MIQLVECPRDAMQGLPHFIDTSIKAAYLDQLLAVGFHTLDFGSFVSPKAIPQMRDTAEVLGMLDLHQRSTRLLAIVANARGAEDALQFPEIDDLGFPLSLSETFQQRNTRKSIAEALLTIGAIQNRCMEKDRRLVVYLSMGFGNPYGDPYAPERVAEFCQELVDMNISVISFADTVGLASPELIESVLRVNIEAFPQVEFGAHLHTRSDQMHSKINAALKAGCRRFDGALQGFGGCPMAEDRLVGNVATEALIRLLESHGFSPSIDPEALREALKLAKVVFAGQ
ncbi:MAG: hydroxymethylglutaryl-CoA lyase [Nitritalea sp.]